MPDQVSRLLPDRTPAGERQWCSIRCPEGEMFNSKPDRCKTLYQIFQRGLSISMDQPCMGYRPTPDAPYFWLTYSEVAQNADNVSSGLIHRGVKKAEFIGISSHNSHEWSTLSIACDSQGFILCPLYDTLGEDAVKFCLNQTELTILFVSEKTINTYIGYLPTSPHIKTIVKIGSDVTDEEKEKAGEHGVTVMTYKDLYAEGEANPVPHNPPQPDDIATICYTSGTTGLPKGAMLSNGAMASTTYAVSIILNETSFVPEDVNISYLPASHVFERELQVTIKLTPAFVFTPIQSSTFSVQETQKG